MNFIKRSFLIITIVSLVVLLISCEEKKKETNKTIKIENGEVAYSPKKDREIQEYNLKEQRRYQKNNTPCDTLDLYEYILNNYSEGSYLVEIDQASTYSIPKYAVKYYNKKNKKYIFGIVAKSRPGERLIETKNIVGYDQSFIDLDSTELGTAFFYLTLFECQNGQFDSLWETPVPSHGGFNYLTMNTWNYNGTPYMKIDFHYGRGIGHIDYNYFFVDGVSSKPHLLMTYEGINFKRTLANVNNDKFPDYYEYLYYDTGDKITVRDSIAFVWNKKDSVYVNTRNRRQTRPY